MVPLRGGVGRVARRSRRTVHRPGHATRLDRQAGEQRRLLPDPAGRGCAPVDAGVPEHTFRSIRGTRRDEVATGPVCYVIPTSGSTGEPKAVAVPPVVLEELGNWHLRRWSHERPPNTLHMSSIGFDMVYEDTVATWLAGATLVVVNDQDRLDPFTLVDIIREHDVARLFQPVVGLHGLATAVCVAGGSIPSLREISVAGEQLVINEEVRKFCADGDLTLVNQYGPSETHVVTQYRLTGDVTDWPDRPPIGTAVVDAELLCLVDGRLRPSWPTRPESWSSPGTASGSGTPATTSSPRRDSGRSNTRTAVCVAATSAETWSRSTAPTSTSSPGSTTSSR
ncbi:AMP-binding protein [Streptomyces sp. M10(2022)]